MATNDQEIWKQITSLKGTTNRNYAVSTHGRLASYDTDINDKQILKPHKNGGFPVMSVNSNGKSKAVFVHNALAETFLKRGAKSTRVIHLDYDKANNHISNLKWVSQAEQTIHNQKSPIVKASLAKKLYKGQNAKKLNEKKVIQLKKELWDPKRKVTLKKLADKYGIAEMNLYRIKKGVLWYHVHVEGEPLFPKYTAQLKNIEFHEKKEAKEKAIKDKLKAGIEAKKKFFAEKKKKREAEKKARLAKLLANRKRKAIERIATDKRIAARAIAAKKAKDLKQKKAASVKKAAVKKETVKKAAVKRVVVKKAKSVVKATKKSKSK